MRHYETTYILRPNLGEEQFTEIIDRTNAIIQNDGGTMIGLDRWGVRRLAYEIGKEVQGYYVYINYAAAAKTVDEIERIFRIDDRVMRYLTVKLNDAINAEDIEVEKQRLEEKVAARSKVQSEESDLDEAGEEFDDESLEDEEIND
ncbi:MAG: 30S ribosomal protein S6 [Desulfobulbus sp.]|nr:30S ribosomal protein S6 [Desulfobulbus sp.]